jgi:hypothetical protein
LPGAGTAGDRLGAEQFRSPQVEEPCHHGGGPGGLSAVLRDPCRGCPPRPPRVPPIVIVCVASRELSFTCSS